MIAGEDQISNGFCQISKRIDAHYILFLFLSFAFGGSMLTVLPNFAEVFPILLVSVLILTYTISVSIGEENEP